MREPDAEGVGDSVADEALDEEHELFYAPDELVVEGEPCGLGPIPAPDGDCVAEVPSSDSEGDGEVLLQAALQQRLDEEDLAGRPAAAARASGDHRDASGQGAMDGQKSGSSSSSSSSSSGSAAPSLAREPREQHLTMIVNEHAKLTLFQLGARREVFAVCSRPGHHPCRMTRTLLPSTRSTRAAQGRPLGLLAAWCSAPADLPKEAHHPATFRASWAQRREARSFLRGLPEAAPFFAAERWPRDGEDSEPALAP